MKTFLSCFFRCTLYRYLFENQNVFRREEGMVLDDVNHASQLYMRNAKNPRILLAINNGIWIGDRCDLGENQVMHLASFTKERERLCSVSKRLKSGESGTKEHKKIIRKSNFLINFFS